jgi:hypothetical protein
VVFEDNAGQADRAVRYLARARGHVAFLTDAGAVLAWERADRGAASRPDGAVARLSFVGAASAARAEAEDALPGRVNHFIGNQAGDWRTGVRTFARVRYRELYRGIDLVWHGARGRMEFDLVVAPGADPGQIRLRVDDAGPLSVDTDGALVLGPGGLVLARPTVYQDGPAGRQRVDGRYALRGPRDVAFALGRYDPARPLVIDPIIVLSTYLGGGADETAAGFVTGTDGSLYVAGSTTSFDFPTRGGVQRALPGFRACFVTKLDPTGTVPVYSTYIGGTADDRCQGLAVDHPGNVYLAGTASSTNFPVTVSARQRVSAGGGSDAVVVKLNPDGNQLLYSTYLGGGGIEVARAVAIDGIGGVWINGVTTSIDFPRKGPLPSPFRGVADSFLARLDTTRIGLDSLVFSLCFGGTGIDGGSFQTGLLVADGGLAVDGDGNAVITGSTTSTDLTLLNPIQLAFLGVVDAFVAKVGPNGAVLWSTYLGGAAADVTFGAATDAFGNVYVAGSTSSFDFPVLSAAQPVKRNGADGFVTKLGPAGGLLYSTFFGGSNDDAVRGIFVDAFARAHVTGGTNSPDLPLFQPVQLPQGGPSDAFVAILGASGAAIEFSTYLGGTGDDAGAAVFADRFGIVYVTGTTASLDFPLLLPLQAGLRGPSDVFLVRIGSTLFVNAAVLPIARSVQTPTVVTFFATMAVNGVGLAVGCRITPVTPTPTTFLFQTTDPSTNALVGTPNTPVSIPGGSLQTCLIAFGTGPAFGPTDVTLNFGCINTPPAQLIAGVNQPTLIVSETPVPDIVALAATVSGDGILTLDAPPAGAPPGTPNAGAFSVATTNLGAGALLTVSADDNGAGLGLDLHVCRTDPVTGMCQTPAVPTLPVQMDSGETSAFAIFASTGEPVPLDPARSRVFARFVDAGGILRGATSVAVRTP